MVKNIIPIGSMYGIFTYIWAIYGVNDGKYSVHGAYGIAGSSHYKMLQSSFSWWLLDPCHSFPVMLCLIFCGINREYQIKLVIKNICI